MSDFMQSLASTIQKVNQETGYTPDTGYNPGPMKSVFSEDYKSTSITNRDISKVFAPDPELQKIDRILSEQESRSRRETHNLIESGRAQAAKANYDNLVKQVDKIRGGEKLLTDIEGVTKGVSGVAGKAALGTLGAMIADTTKQVGNLSANPGDLLPHKPFLVLYRNKDYTPSLGSTQGHPSNEYVPLSSCHGFTRVKSINLQISGATEEEKREREKKEKKRQMLRFRRSAGSMG